MIRYWSCWNCTVCSSQMLSVCVLVPRRWSLDSCHLFAQRGWDRILLEFRRIHAGTTLIHRAKEHLQNASRHLDSRTMCRGPSCDLRWPSWCAHWWFGGLQVGLPKHFGWALHLCPGWRDQTLRCHHSTGDQCGHHLQLAAHLVVGALHQGWSDLWALASNMALSKNRASENHLNIPGFSINVVLKIFLDSLMPLFIYSYWNFSGWKVFNFKCIWLISFIEESEARRRAEEWPQKCLVLISFGEIKQLARNASRRNLTFWLFTRPAALG